MKVWILYGIILHILLLGSIFVTYFRTPVITGLQPQNDLKNPPAKRLVLIVTDGLRANSFFKDDFKYVPNLKRIFLNQGLLGLSHTRVPTESRPGHIAIIAGLYEDPSAVTRGWKENPIDFDSVFNRSRKTFAWGSHDILSIFAKCTDTNKMEFSSYKDNLDFSGNDETYLLDEWVFERVERFLKEKAKDIKNNDKIIFFLHLLGLDTSGHIHKPQSDIFHQNLLYTEKRIYNIYKLFEEIFNDNKTSYILTSDHGMTNLGSHGSGDNYETETPLMIWGSGINNWYDKNFYIHNNNLKRFIQTENKSIPLLEIEQADLTPLISSIIGISVPMNNFGKLPLNLLNATNDYLLIALFNNALQMFTQYTKLRNDFNKGLFSSILNNFNKIDENDIKILEKYILMKDKLSNDKLKQKLTEQILELLNNSLEGIEYFQMYYKNILQFCIVITCLGWIFQLIIMLDNQKIEFNIHKIPKYMFIIFIIEIIFLLLQNIPLSIGIYFILPIISWIIPLQQNVKFQKIFNLMRKNFKKLFLLLIGIELLVLTFFIRQIISFIFSIFVGYIAYKLLINNKSKEHVKNLIYSHIISIILLTFFPFLPIPNGRNDNYLILFALSVWIIRLKNDINLKNNKICVIFSIIFTINFLICSYFYNYHIGVLNINLILSWLLLLISFLAPILQYTSIKIKIKLIIHYLTAIYLSLSLSYESIFIICLGSYFLSRIEIDNEYKEKLIEDEINTNDLIINSTSSSSSVAETINKWKSIERAFIILLFVMLSFFGTGNIASISSFDPNICRYYITIFSPFIMMSLIILKLCIPLILIITGFCWIIINKQNNYEIFISMLIICKVMSLNFFFMIKNKGSWLDIGTSISHYVIIEVTTIILALIYFIVKSLIMFNLKNFIKSLK